jgi:Reverse transcriptase (RNA-dependent DNA polymerase)
MQGNDESLPAPPLSGRVYDPGGTSPPSTVPTATPSGTDNRCFPAKDNAPRPRAKLYFADNHSDNNVRSQSPVLAVIDSGATATIVPEGANLPLSSVTDVHLEFSGPGDPPEQPSVTATKRGFLSDDFPEVLTGNVQQGLVSIEELQSHGKLVLFPHDRPGECYVIDHEHGNRVVAHAVSDFTIDLALSRNKEVYETVTFTPDGDIIVHAPLTKFSPAPGRPQRSTRRNVLSTLKLYVGHLRSLVGKANSGIPSDRRKIAARVHYWHEALGHPSDQILAQIAKYHTIEGLNVTEEQVRANPTDCSACDIGNTRRTSVPDESTREPTSHVGERVWLDSYGNIKVKSVGGNNYVYHFIDEHSRFVFPVVTKGAKDATAANAVVKTAKAEFALHKHPFEKLHADADPVFTAAEHQDFLHDDELIASALAPPGVHERNGIPERLHQHQRRKVTVMFLSRFGRYVPRPLYMYAVVLTDVLRNIAPDSRRTDGKSPWELFYGSKPDLQKMKLLPFGQPVAPMVVQSSAGAKGATTRDTTPWKFSPTRRLAMYLGPNFVHPRCINCYDPLTRTVFVSGDFTVLDYVPPEWEIPSASLSLNTKQGDDIHFEGSEGDIWAMVLAPANITMLVPFAQVAASIQTENSSVRALGDEPSHAAMASSATPEPCATNAPSPTSTASQPINIPAVHSDKIGGASAQPAAAEDDYMSASDTDETDDSHRESLPTDSYHHRSKGANLHSEPYLSSTDAPSAPAPRRSERAGKGTHSSVFDPSHPRIVRRHRRALLLALRKIGKKKVGAGYKDNPTVKQALQSDDAQEWIRAIKKELETLEATQTYEIVANVPPGFKALPCHLVLKQKRLADGTPDKKKARAVVGGNHQTADMFDETSSPTARMISFKTLLQLAAANDLEMASFDIGSAFLRAEIDKEIYVTIPNIDDPLKPIIARLLKSLYGLKQAGKLWYENIKKALIAFDMVPTQHDPCVFVYFKGDDVMYLSLHVDDMLVVSNSSETIEALFTHLVTEYKEVTRTDVESHLGINIKRDRTAGTITIDQPGLIDKVLEVLGLASDSTKAVDTPAVAILRDPDSAAIPLDSQAHGEYAAVVGMFLYLVISRPEISFAVSMLSSKSHAPTSEDWSAAKRVGRYLIGTRHLGTVFSKGTGHIWAHGYADASYASHPDARSHSGNVFNLYPFSGPIYVMSKKQSLVALSSTEAELEALKSMTTLVPWVRGFLLELGLDVKNSVPIFEDNEATIHLAHQDGNWGRTRHFAVRYQYIRSQIEDNSIEVFHCPTNFMVSDIFTKPLEREPFCRLRDILLGYKNSQFVEQFLPHI